MKKVVSFVLLLCVVLSMVCLITASVSAASSGSIGSCEWVLDGAVLTVKGKGSMGSSSSWPWGKTFTKLVVEEGVTDIGQNAFANCTSLTEVVLPSTLRTVNSGAFKGCTALKSIALPDGVATIDYKAFDGCVSLKEIVIPKSVSNFSMAEFGECENLKRITVDPNNKVYCSVDGVLFSKDMKTLLKYPSDKDGNAYTVPDTVEIIGYKAFEGAWRLLNVDLPDGLARICVNAFWGTPAYHRGNTVDGVLYIEDCLIVAKDNTFENSVIKSGTRLIADGAFVGCSKITKMWIPDGVTSIGDSAFWCCGNLESVSIPASVKEISAYAFLDCGKLKTVYYRGGEEDRDGLSIDSENDPLFNAEWYYGACYNGVEHNVGECKTEKEPTCTEAGEKVGRCTSCGSDVTVEIAPTGHMFEEWSEESAPTCNAEGIEKRTCSVCELKETKSVAALGHKYGESEVTVEPTYEEEGMRTAKCELCGESKNEVIPRLEGEPNMFTVWDIIIIALAVVIGIVLLIIGVGVAVNASKRD